MLSLSSLHYHASYKLPWGKQLLPGHSDFCSICRGLLHCWDSNCDDIWDWPSSITGTALPVPSSPRTCCPLCVLLILAADRIASDRWVTARPEYIQVNRDRDTLKLEGSDYAVFKKKDTLDKFDASSVSWEKIRRWLADCDNHNHSSCFSPSKRARLLNLQLRLIDTVESRIVTIPPEGEYAALSYKWGGIRQPCLKRDNLDKLQQLGALDNPESCGQTIKDAMEICRNVGIRYLWVDALCIMQDSPHKWQHMQNMDAIYASASFTIVPADSEDANHGIHGVSQKRRRAHCHEVDSFLFEFGVNSVTDWLAKSPWAGRSWTYQEATLSRRLLVFTEELCCLICPNGMLREDDHPEPPRKPSASDPFMLLQYEKSFSSERARPLVTFPHWEAAFDEYQCWVSKSLEDGILKFSPLEMYAITLSNYLRKSITKPEDILEAFTGIITELQPRMGLFSYGLPRFHLLEALTWQYNQIPLEPNEFHSSGRRFYPIGRREGSFPSWSWCGWEHCPGAQISLTSCALEETKPTADGTRKAARMIAVYIRDQNHALIRLNRSDGSTLELFNSKLSDADEDHIHHVLPGLVAPVETLLFFKTIIMHVDVPVYPFFEEGRKQEPEMEPEMEPEKEPEEDRKEELGDEPGKESEEERKDRHGEEHTEGPEEKSEGEPEGEPEKKSKEERERELKEEREERRGEGRWAMFPVADGDDKLKLRRGMVTMVHLEVAWRKRYFRQANKSDDLAFAILGIFPDAEFGSSRVIALVVEKKAGVYYRKGIAEFNVDPDIPDDEYLEMLSKTGSHETIILG